MPPPHSNHHSHNRSNRYEENVINGNRLDDENNCWVQIISSNSGRPFYYHPVTKQTTWDLPTGAKLVPSSDYNNANDQEKENLVAIAANNTASEQGSSVGREQVFMDLLSKKGVQPDWTWERTLKEIHLHPDYHAVPRVADKKRLFADHQNQIRHRQQQQRLAEIEQCIPRLQAWLDDLDERYENFASLKPAVIFQSLEWVEFLSSTTSLNADDGNNINGISESSNNCIKWTLEEFIVAFDQWHHTVERRRQERYSTERQQAKNTLQAMIVDLVGTNINTLWIQVKPILIERLSPFLQSRVLIPKDLLYAFEDYIDVLSSTHKDSNANKENDIPSISNNNEQLWDQFIKDIEQYVGVSKGKDEWTNFVGKLCALPYIDELLLSISSAPVRIIKLYEDTVENHILEYCERHYSKLDKYFSSSSSSTTNSLFRHLFQCQTVNKDCDLVHALSDWFASSCSIKNIIPKWALGKYFEEQLRVKYQDHVSDKHRQLGRQKRLRLEITHTLQSSYKNTDIANEDIVILNFKHALKHQLQPPIEMESSFENYWDQIQGLPEFLAMCSKITPESTNDNGKLLALTWFEKYQRYLQRSTCSQSIDSNNSTTTTTTSSWTNDNDVEGCNMKEQNPSYDDDDDKDNDGKLVQVEIEEGEVVI